MNIRIKTTGYEMTQETQSYLNERLLRIEKLLNGDAELARCEVEIGRDAGNQRHGANLWFAEFNIQSPGGRLVRATNRSESINGAIDDAKAEAERQIRRERKVHIRMWRRSGAAFKKLLRMGD
ncbi:MAG: HPF/RaiA family ribosome-associated protein [Patescibacteria group bacterium]